MRLGLDLRPVADADERLALAAEADRLGLWAVLVGGGEAGTEPIEAATMAAHTSSIHVAVLLAGDSEHPLTLAEELAVLDHLSERRIVAVIEGEQAVVDRVERFLHGHIVDGVALTPPPAQTRMPVWSATELTHAALRGDSDADAQLVDRHRDDGCTHLFVAWTGPPLALARHLATRAVGPDFPSIVAELADRL